MRETCGKRVFGIFIAVVGLIISQFFNGVTTLAQSSDPSLLPRLSFSDLSYAGGFRLPAEASNGDSFARGGQAVAFNPDKPSLFVSSRAGLVAEVNIPAPVISSDVTNMPFAQYLQGFADPVEGRIGEVASWGVWTNSLLVQNGRLFGTASMYYDANNEQRVSHFSRSLRLNESSFLGWTQVWQTGKAGFVAGLLASVPSEWQQRLGGAMVSGQCCVPIVSRTSWGPASFAFDPASIGQPAVAATPLLYYTGDHPTLGAWSGSNENYGESTEMGGMVIVAGTRTALFFGRNGIGPACYGNGTSDQSLVGTIGTDGAPYCYDPTSASKGTHAYPYRYQIWAYDLNDFAAVKAGTKNAWDVYPYDVWPFEFPTQEVRVSMGGVSYDASRQTIYVSQSYADPDVYESRPIIHVLKVNGTGTPLAPPAPMAPAPATTQVTSLNIAGNLSAPQGIGTAITFTAVASGGATPLQFKWLTSSDGVSWTSGAWSTSNQFTWTPTAAAQYQVRVWARSGTSTADQPEALATVPFTIGSTTSASPLAVVVGGSSSPQLVGSTLSFQATVTGGNAPYQFKWLVFDGSAWSVRVDWGTNNTFTWTPSVAGSDYRIAVWVRNAGDTADVAAGSVTVPFIVTAPAPAARISGVQLTSDVASPQEVGTMVRWTARASGGSGTLQYRWSIYDGTTWSTVGGWNNNNTLNWKSGTIGSYQISVGVRSASSTADQPEASDTKPYSLVAASTGGTGNSGGGPLKSVTLDADRPAPQAPNTTVSWTATVSGNAPPLYKWLVYDGTKWQVVVDWSTSARFSWRPAVAGNYVVAVWVKRVSNTSDQFEVSSTAGFVIK